MDESHRLVPMKPGYDPQLFERLYREVRPLVNKLAFGIDSRRFGVETRDIVSMFDIKFIHAFNRYTHTDKEQYIKGYIINSLSLYSKRLMTLAYKPEFEEHHTQLDISSLYDETQIDEDICNHDHQRSLLKKVKRFLRKTLTDNEYLIFQTELNPPAWIHREMQEAGKPINAKIPNALIAEYLDLKGREAENYVRDCRININKAIDLARTAFRFGYAYIPSSGIMVGSGASVIVRK